MKGIFSRLARLDVRREMLYVARAMAEACVLAPWLAAFALLYRPDVSIQDMATAIFAIILLTSYLARALGITRLGDRAQRGLALVSLLGFSAWAVSRLELGAQPGASWSGLLSDTFQLLTGSHVLVPASLSIVVGIAFLWWRGLRLAQKPFSLLDVSLGFQIGVLAFALFVLMGSSQARQDINPVIIAFFFCQLLAIGLTRVETIGSQPGGRRSPFGGWWAAVLTASAGSVVIIASLIVALVLGVGPEQILRWLAPVLAIVMIPISILALPLIALAGMLLEWLINVIQLRQLEWLQMLEGMQQATPEPPPEATPSAAAQALSQVLGYGKGLAVLVVLALIVAAVVWRVGRSQARRLARLEEEHESSWSSRSWAERLRRRLGERLKRIGAAANLLARFGAGGLFTALSIRRMYAQLQQLAAKRGYPRQPSETPYEYLDVLYECLPGSQADVQQLTEAYVGVHYGELPERPDELAALREAWERIRESSASAAARQAGRRRAAG